MARPNVPLPQLTPKRIEQFWAKVAIGLPDECWPWQKLRDKDGYGIVHIGINGRGQKLRTSRLAYFLHYSVDPGNNMVCHTCDYPPCCNPSHFFLGDGLANSQDMIAKGREYRGERHHFKLRPEICRRGENHYRAKLTDEQIYFILEHRELGCWRMAKLVGVSVGHIKKIRRRGGRSSTLRNLVHTPQAGFPASEDPDNSNQ